MVDFNPEKSTMELMSEAYSEVLTKLKEQSELLETPASKAQKEKKAQMRNNAGELLKLNILNSVISKEYEELVKNIKDKKAQIEALYGVSITDDSLDAVKTAFDSVKASYDREYERLSEEYKNKSSEMKLEFRAKEFEENESFCLPKKKLYRRNLTRLMMTAINCICRPYNPPVGSRFWATA